MSPLHRPITVSFHEMESLSLKCNQRSGRGRPRQNTKVYDAEIYEALKQDDSDRLKIARNKKSSQVYRMKKRNQIISLEKNLLKQSKINKKFEKKLQKLVKQNESLLELLTFKPINK